MVKKSLYQPYNWCGVNIWEIVWFVRTAVRQMYIAGGLILYAVSQNADAVVVMPKACCGLISCSVRAGLRVTAIRR